ncbi:hypothetical protein [Sphingomonas arenae]|uniref:hypothetical protein n=1 Tax=Sphingomonas arenae TaxID=2812555 RepID=UPI0019689B5D|nr:hypothetical protein [Sphingomonas arenae]
MLRMLSLAAGALLLMAASPAAADPACAASMRPSAGVARLIYDPLNAVQETLEIELLLEQQSAKPCRYALAIAGAGSSRQRMMRDARGQLTYELQINGVLVSNDLNAPAAINGNGRQVSRGSGEERKTRTIRLKAMIPAGQFAPAGLYEDQLTLRLYDVTDGVPQQVGSDVPLIIGGDVPARAQINLAGTSSSVFGSVNAAGLSFGQLVTGAERDAYIQVRATAPVLLTISSANKGAMRHRSEPAATAIPYAFSVDGQALDLRGGPKRLDRNPARGLQAENYRMAVRITDADNRQAGTYEDVITITVEPK